MIRTFAFLSVFALSQAAEAEATAEAEAQYGDSYSGASYIGATKKAWYPGGDKSQAQVEIIPNTPADDSWMDNFVWADEYDPTEDYSQVEDEGDYYEEEWEPEYHYDEIDYDYGWYEDPYEVDVYNMWEDPYEMYWMPEEDDYYYEDPYYDNSYYEDDQYYEDDYHHDDDDFYVDERATYAECHFNDPSGVFGVSGVIKLAQVDEYDFVSMSAEIFGFQPETTLSLSVNEFGTVSDNCSAAGDRFGSGIITDLHPGPDTIVKEKFEDPMSTLQGEDSIIGRSLVLSLGYNGVGSRVACCSIVRAQPPRPLCNEGDEYSNVELDPTSEQELAALKPLVEEAIALPIYHWKPLVYEVQPSNARIRRASIQTEYDVIEVTYLDVDLQGHF